jgi:hypothetical protein
VSEAKHTPGPWILSESLGSSNSYKIEKEPGGLVVKIYGRDANIPTGEIVRVKRTEANARLIAAAPDLLAACENALATITGERVGGAISTEIELRAAIAKAKGEQ